MQIELDNALTIGELLAMAKAHNCRVRAMPDGTLRLQKNPKPQQEIKTCQSTIK